MTTVPLLLRLLVKHPHEFFDRVTDRLTIPRSAGQAATLSAEYALGGESALEWQAAMELLEDVFGEEVWSILEEPALRAIQHHIDDKIRVLAGASTAIPLDYNADYSLARFCYVVCRLRKPLVVVETGVAYGVTTAFILAALRQNERGFLHSIDLPPLVADVDRFVGSLVPSELNARWRFHRRSSRSCLLYTSPSPRDS